ncbi:MAG: indole-3-glycerol-phosphate synthase [Acidobacteriota bacterium]
MQGILARIVEKRRLGVAAMKEELSLERLREKARRIPTRGGFLAALRQDRPGGFRLPVIAELKQASPSAGRISTCFAPRSLAADLAAGGASALSVLTEPDFFQGDGDFLAQARFGAPGLPLLRKDFIFDPWQVWESRWLQADAILLIASLLPGGCLERLLECAAEADLDVLVEAATGEEISQAVAAGARAIGVNARNLEDFSVDLARCSSLRRIIPSSVLAVAESGVGSRQDLIRMEKAGFAAVLVGTALMRQDRPGALLARWLQPGPIAENS